MARMSLRIDFGAEGRLGPGKIRLLEAIGEQGSISAAGRSLGMSYRRAWCLIAELNQTFSQPVLNTNVGGKQGGGASLTEFGREVIDRYRQIEVAAHQAAAVHLEALEREAQPGDQPAQG